jgi:predicted nucleic acid-binding Zn ribbon protein
MPTYSFRDTNTGEVFDKFMRIAEREDYLTQNPHLETTITSAPAFTGDHISSVKKYDSGFKEVLQRIHEKTPGSQLDKSSSQL